MHINHFTRANHPLRDMWHLYLIQQLVCAETVRLLWYPELSYNSNRNWCMGSRSIFDTCGDLYIFNFFTVTLCQKSLALYCCFMLCCVLRTFLWSPKVWVSLCQYLTWEFLQVCSAEVHLPELLWSYSWFWIDITGSCVPSLSQSTSWWVSTDFQPTVRALCQHCPKLWHLSLQYYVKLSDNVFQHLLSTPSLQFADLGRLAIFSSRSFCYDLHCSNAVTISWN